jgi:hypothetical protein
LEERPDVLEAAKIFEEELGVICELGDAVGDATYLGGEGSVEVGPATPVEGFFPVECED